MPHRNVRHFYRALKQANKAIFCVQPFDKYRAVIV